MQARSAMAVAEARRLKEAGLDLIALPIVVLLVAAIGDLAAGRDASVHFVQLTPFVWLLVLGWRFPHATGLGLIMIASAAAITWFATIAMPPAAAIVTGVVAFLPPVIAGYLLIEASRSG